MSEALRSIRIRPASPADLDVLHDLASAAMWLDDFSPALLAEKLFQNPRPEANRFEAYLAEQGDRPVGLMQSVLKPEDHKAWVGIFAVRADCRRRGIASALFERVLTAWKAAGIREAEALAIPGNYFNPGVDPRYTEGLCFLEGKGFQRFKDCVNLLARLDKRFDTRAEQDRLAESGIVVRRAGQDDGGLLDSFFAQDFGADWRLEAGLAMAVDPPALHLALEEGRIIGFSAHSTQNREWGFFGPMGTTPAARGHGIGRVLLWHCLNDMRDAGHATSVIPWVGPICFYSLNVPCRVDRVFWRYRLDLT
jgi:GNAT superfamily N-acetyltransferase